jgi:ribosome maturation factor RimP
LRIRNETLPTLGRYDMKELKEKLRRTLSPLIQNTEVELIDLEVKGSGPYSILRIYVDKPGGITLEECAQLSSKLSDFLDVEDLIPQRYTLEVSSPGLDRPLISEKDFARKIGENVKVFLKEPLGKKIELEGKIKDLKEGKLVLDEEGEEKRIPLEKILKGKITF